MDHGNRETFEVNDLEKLIKKVYVSYAGSYGFKILHWGILLRGTQA